MWQASCAKARRLTPMTWVAMNPMTKSKRTANPKNRNRPSVEACTASGQGRELDPVHEEAATDPVRRQAAPEWVVGAPMVDHEGRRRDGHVRGVDRLQHVVHEVRDAPGLPDELEGVESVADALQGCGAER